MTCAEFFKNRTTLMPWNASAETMLAMAEHRQSCPQCLDAHKEAVASFEAKAPPEVKAAMDLLTEITIAGPEVQEAKRMYQERHHG